MVDDDGQFDVVTAVETVELDRPGVRPRHRAHAQLRRRGLVTHNSIYKFRGADFRNLVRFEEVFPEATIIVLEQNYRSSQRILDAANAVIANNAARRPKHLWTEQVGGELITRYHAEDEHDEASFVVHEIGCGSSTPSTTASATSRSSTAPTRRAASIEESLVRAGRRRTAWSAA